jgi:lysophospholipase L1-like esterase
MKVSDNYGWDHSMALERWNVFNQVLERVCAEQGVAYYYFGQQLMDENGYLDPALAEGDVHPSDAGDAVWVRALRAYAARQMYPDALVLYPPTEDGDGR